MLMKRFVPRLTPAILAVALFMPNPLTGSVDQALAGCSDTAAAGVNWEDCRKRNLIMSEFDFSGSNFSRADLSSSDLRSTILSGSNFKKTNLVRASLKGAKADGTDFSNALASRTDFSEGNYSGSTFRKAETTRVNFMGSDLSGSDMSRAEFGRANFTNANLSGVNFNFSNLARADLRGIQFETAPSFANAFLFQTRIDGVDLSQATGLEEWQVNLACGDDATKLPDGMERPADWPCAEEDDS